MRAIPLLLLAALGAAAPASAITYTMETDCTKVIVDKQPRECFEWPIRGWLSTDDEVHVPGTTASSILALDDWDMVFNAGIGGGFGFSKDRSTVRFETIWEDQFEYYVHLGTGISFWAHLPNNSFNQIDGAAGWQWQRQGTVPEPGTLLLLGFALAGLAIARRRKELVG